jgi:hypothetical protein
MGRLQGLPDDLQNLIQEAVNFTETNQGLTLNGTTSVFNGNILCQTAIVLNTGATLNGRALAQTAVTLDASAVVKPTP